MRTPGAFAALLVFLSSCAPGKVVGGSPGDPGAGAGGGNGGGGNGGPEPGGGPGGAGGSGGAGGPGGAAGCASCDPASCSDLAGCPCASGSADRSCGSDVGACRKGTQSCVTGGGTATGGKWGPCVGSKLPEGEKCGDGVDNDCNGAADCADPKCDEYCKGRDGGADAPPATCECVSDAVRWCHAGTGCYRGKQTCRPDGTWGGCVETTEPFPPPVPGSPDFKGKESCTTIPTSWNLCCCLAADLCCEFSAPLPESGNWKPGHSLGKCAGISCGRRPEWPLAPPASCGAKGLCVPGALRGCLPQDKMIPGDPTIAFWGVQTCTADGGWGTCAEAAPPSDCLVTDKYGKKVYPGYWRCCKQTGRCCKADYHSYYDCGHEDSIGGCAATACR